MKPKKPYKSDILSADRTIPETEKSSAVMLQGQMDNYSDDKKPREPVVANSYNAKFLRDEKRETPETWILETLLDEEPQTQELVVGQRLFPEYSIPVRFLDAQWSENLTLGALKLLHVVFATCIAENSNEVTIRKRALAAYLAKSKSSLSTSLMKESISRLEDLSVRIGIRRLLGRQKKAAPVLINKVFTRIEDCGDSYQFKISEDVAKEFANPKLYAPIGLNVIQEFPSLHSLLLFTAMMGDLTVSYHKFKGRMKSALSEIKKKKLKAIEDGFDMTEWIEVPEWKPGYHEINLDSLADLIGLPDDKTNRQKKRIQKRVIDAAERIDALFGGSYIGPKLKVHEDYGSETIKDRKNLATTSDMMKVAIRAPWRPAQYQYASDELIKLLTLETTTDLYVSPIDFKNALTVAGFDANDPQLAPVIHADWKAFLYRNRSQIEDGAGVQDLFSEYYEGLISAGRFGDLDELGLGRKVGTWWSKINGTEANLEGDAVPEKSSGTLNKAKPPVLVEPERENLPQVLTPTPEESSIINLFDLVRDREDHSKVYPKSGGSDMSEFLTKQGVRIDTVPFAEDRSARNYFS